MEKISLDHLTQRLTHRLAQPRTDLPEDEYEHYVHLTSKLIKRSYIATHKLVERWPLEKIKRRYLECTKHAGDMPGDIKWWWLRKREKGK